MLIIHYSPNNHNLPDCYDFDAEVIRVGKQQAISNFPTSGDVKTRWFLPIVIVSSMISDKKIDHKDCLLIEYTENSKINISFFEDGEIDNLLADRDDYQFNLLIREIDL